MLEPARTIIDMCGGVKALSQMINVAKSNVYRWSYPVERGGSGGMIPTRQQAKLLAAARAKGIDLRPEHFFPKAAE